MSFRKYFFKNYIFAAFENMKKTYPEERESHTALANSVLVIPSQSSFLIFPDSWNHFTNEMSKLLKEKLPFDAKYGFAALMMHGIKSDQEITKSNLEQVRRTYILSTIVIET